MNLHLRLGLPAILFQRTHTKLRNLHYGLETPFVKILTHKLRKYGFIFRDLIYKVLLCHPLLAVSAKWKKYRPQ